MLRCIDNFDARDINKLQNILFRQPALHRRIRQLKETNIFHRAVNYAAQQSSSQDMADVQVLKVLIDHELWYCDQNQGKSKFSVKLFHMSALFTYRMFPSVQYAKYRWQNATTSVYSEVVGGHGAFHVPQASGIGLVQDR